MGRELKRVPLDFQWPINTVWSGYLNPHYEGHCKNCAACEGTGSSPQSRMLKDVWYGYIPFRPELNGSEPFTRDMPEIRQHAEHNVRNAPDYYGTGSSAIAKESERLCVLFNGSWNHHLNQMDVDALWAEGRLTHSFNEKPTAKEVNLWSIRGFGHDAINSWICIEARCKANGWDSTCVHCKGHGSIWDSTENEKIAEAWKKEEPPTGEGYQIWETVSEGSPISPVFSTPDELAAWMSNNNRGVDEGTTKEQWLRFIEGPGWAPSFIGSEGQGVVTGVQAGV